ncbi:hypothetical protein PP175_14970 [Aneurinibacillus sp. Ricciae_BoGa-3]|uniref:hypothetical protein n=1 Tax=Aneurinibacillus sp. Ricciae_BoGa-3 TaxID=3022697 RepID=UPI0023404403|nr:hypothetical protein [Aneurinibacillus sp. Ricciae_BoGa-3]WCK52729.1 hypothetical protein PP175_14970 [Aneurinibacillus sp. Ricciae_BoGa-3]
MLYYSERDSSRSDQLFKLDLKTKQKTQLTTNLYAINRMIPIDNKMILAASLKGNRNIPLASYDLKANKLTIWQKDLDTSVRSLSLNPLTSKLYASLYSQKEQLEKTHKADLEQAPDVVPPVHRVVEYDINGQMLKEIYKTEEMITFFSQNEYMALIRTAPTMFKQRKLYLLNPNG